jgi:hypothetical protein
MTSKRLQMKLGKQPGKQIQDAVGIWGSTAILCDRKLSRSRAPSLRAAGLGTFEARRAPKLAVRRYDLPPVASPPASPVSPSGGGKQKTAPEGRSKQLIFLRKSGAGDGIRTHDPNLGKVVLYP